MKNQRLNKMKCNPQIHHRRSIRLKGYYYSQAGAYFITICCHNRECLFGHVADGQMVLSQAGNIAYNEWIKTRELRPNVELDVFVIMPNHMHGIIVINDVGRGVSHTPHNNDASENSTTDGGIPGGGRGVSHTPHNNDTTQNPITDGGISGGGKGVLHTPYNENVDTPQYVSGDDIVSDVCNTPHDQNTSPDKRGVCNTPLRSPSQTIGAIVRGYKSSVTKQINVFRDCRMMVWQRNYHEHIIRNEKSYQTISDYIINNPAKWNDDKFYEP